jgi:hypothetical protein
MCPGDLVITNRRTGKVSVERNYLNMPRTLEAVGPIRVLDFDGSDEGRDGFEAGYWGRDGRWIKRTYNEGEGVLLKDGTILLARGKERK